MTCPIVPTRTIERLFLVNPSKEHLKRINDRFDVFLALLDYNVFLDIVVTGENVCELIMFLKKLKIPYEQRDINPQTILKIQAGALSSFPRLQKTITPLPNLLFFPLDYDPVIIKKAFPKRHVYIFNAVFSSERELKKDVFPNSVLKVLTNSVFILEVLFQMDIQTILERLDIPGEYHASLLVRIRDKVYYYGEGSFKEDPSFQTYFDKKTTLSLNKDRIRLFRGKDNLAADGPDLNLARNVERFFGDA